MGCCVRPFNGRRTSPRAVRHHTRGSRRATRSRTKWRQRIRGYVLAVADGVVDAVDGLAEPTTPITLDNAGGNYVTSILAAAGSHFTNT